MSADCWVLLVTYSSVVEIVVLLWLSVSVARVVLEWIWLGPKRLEKMLWEQGITGNPYKILFGDLKDNLRMTKEAQSKSFPLFSNDTASRVVPFYVQIMKDHGRVCLFWNKTKPRVIVNDPELVREILTTKFGHYEKTKLHPVLRLIFPGISSYDGQKWAKHRRIINPAFQMEKLKRMLPAFVSCSNKLIERWEEKLGGGGGGSIEIDVFPEFKNLTGDVISQTAFGTSYEEGRQVIQLQAEQFELFTSSLPHIHVPGYRFLPTKSNRRRREIERESRALVRALMVKREKAAKGGGGVQSEDLLGYLMESNTRYLEENAKSSKLAGMSVEEVIDECKLFYFAGQETTAVFLTWTLIMLAMHQNWQDRAREEVIQIFGKNKPSFGELSQLKTVTMILYEVLRLYPPIPNFVRSTYKEVQMGRYSLPKGVELLCPVLLIHHDPRHWGEDSLEFRPERFAEGISHAAVTAAGHQHVAFFPFSQGPRTCIGQNFAMNEAKLAVSMILQNFSFELSPSYNHAPCAFVTNQPQHGAQILLSKVP